MEELVVAGTREPFPAQHLPQLVLRGDWSRLVAGGFLMAHLEEETALGLTFFSCKGPQIHCGGFLAPFPTRGQHQPCLAPAAVACVGGNPRLGLEIGLQRLGTGISLWFLAMTHGHICILGWRSHLLPFLSCDFAGAAGLQAGRGLMMPPAKFNPEMDPGRTFLPFFTSRWQFSRPAPTNLSGGRAVQIIDFLVSLKL